jgi:hypothetical protein
MQIYGLCALFELRGLAVLGSGFEVEHKEDIYTGSMFGSVATSSNRQVYIHE